MSNPIAIACRSTTRRAKIHINVRLPEDIFAHITKRARQHKQDFTAELTDILTVAIIVKETRS